jgi:hypothetical protein
MNAVQASCNAAWFRVSKYTAHTSFDSAYTTMVVDKRLRIGNMVQSAQVLLPPNHSKPTARIQHPQYIHVKDTPVSASIGTSWCCSQGQPLGQHPPLTLSGAQQGLH